MFFATLIAATLAPPCDHRAAQSVVSDMNLRRAGAHLAPLALDPRLAAIALARADDLVERQYFGHVSPDGTTAIDALHDGDIPFRYAGENLAQAESVPVAESLLWASPNHRENIMEAHYRRVGVAVVATAQDGEIVVQIFTD
jgi:uncharacterized protein YkwD